ncbi:DUF4192 family protein [Enteractinococcus coprophilus]|nr:DUF4192 family protein [Enteractinococcus coprophilus]
MRPEHNDQPVPTSKDRPVIDPGEASQRYALANEPGGNALGNDSKHELTRRHRVGTPEEILAYVQATLGFRPTHSLTIVAFADRQLSTVVRCDLPDALHKMLQSDTLESVTFLDFGITETQELQLMELGKQLGQLIAREPSTTGCLLVYLATEVSVSDHQALAATGTVNAMLSAQFGLQGILVEESWLIHHHQLWHLRCASTIDCEIQGDVLGDPESTDLFQRLDPEGKTRQRSGTAMEKLVFPLASQPSSRDVSSIYDLLEQRPKVVLNWLQRWDERLSHGPSMLHTDHVAELLSTLEHPELRDAVLGIACFDLNTSIQGMLALGRFSDEIAVLSRLQGDMRDGTDLKGCLLGQSERIPDWQRIAALERVCHQLLPLSDHASGGGVAGLLVWIEWVRGRGSIALDYLRQARKHFPRERLLILLENVLRQGKVAAWATRTESAWSPRHAA